MGRKDLTTQRQDAILDAAERCIASYGLQGATLEKIASEANLNRGLIHHYIGNRDDLIQLMVERLIEKYQTSFKNYSATKTESNHAELIIDYYFDAWFEMAPEDDALIVELLAESERDSHIRKLLLNLYNGFENMIAKELAQRFPKADSKNLHSISYSLMLLAFSHATITWLGLPQAKRANVRSIAANLVQTLSS
jgi:AcrR family transcriptional regulator